MRIHRALRGTKRASTLPSRRPHGNAPALRAITVDMLSASPLSTPLLIRTSNQLRQSAPGPVSRRETGPGWAADCCGGVVPRQSVMLRGRRTVVVVTGIAMLVVTGVAVI